MQLQLGPFEGNTWSSSAVCAAEVISFLLTKLSVLNSSLHSNVKHTCTEHTTCTYESHAHVARV